MTEEEKSNQSFDPFIWASIVYGQVYFLEILHFASRTGIHCRLFLGIMSFPKFWRNCLWWSHFLIKTWLWTWAQNFTKFHHRSFHDNILKFLHQKLWKIPGKHLQFLINEIAQLQSIVYYCILTYFSESAQKGKDVLKFQKLEKTFEKLSL